MPRRNTQDQQVPSPPEPPPAPEPPRPETPLPDPLNYEKRGGTPWGTGGGHRTPPPGRGRKTETR